MKDRIKKIRKELDLTQQKFGERIGVKGNTIAQYENGRNQPIDAVISLICREFNVNEEWLRTGTGGKLESAKKFKHWVTSEVLPSIRKTGAYNKKQISFNEQLKVLKTTMETLRMDKASRLLMLEDFYKRYGISTDFLTKYKCNMNNKEVKPAHPHLVGFFKECENEEFQN